MYLPAAMTTDLFDALFDEVGRKVLGASGEQLVYVDAISPGGSGLKSLGWG